jgi:hypothetical protein
MNAIDTGPDYLERLARFAGQTPAEAVPEHVIERTKELPADSIPVYATGMRSAPLGRARQTPAGDRGAGARPGAGARRDREFAGRRHAQRHRRRLAGLRRG